MEAIRILIGAGLIYVASPSLAFDGFGADVDAYIREASQRYQVSELMLRGLVKMEDGWLNKTSFTGASGVGQFTFGTWNWLATFSEGQAIGMKPITARTRDTYADPRRNKRVNTLATALLARWHIEQFAIRRIAVTDANLYMAHNIGLDGFHRALIGRSTADDIRNMRRNGMKRGMKVKDFIVYQKNRYYTHKQIANASIRSKALPPTMIASNVTMKPKHSPKAVSNTNATNVPLQEEPTLRWVQPSDKEMLWVNPITSL